MPRKRKPVINAKRAKLLKEIQKQVRQGRTPNVSEAGRAAGFSAPQAAIRSYHTIRQHLPALLNEAGLDVVTLLKGFKESEQALETRFYAHNGIVMDTREVIAHDIRIRARTEIAKLHDLYPRNDERLDQAPANQIFNINLGFIEQRTAETVLNTARERSGIDDSGRLGVDESRDENP